MIVNSWLLCFVPLFFLDFSFCPTGFFFIASVCMYFSHTSLKYRKSCKKNHSTAIMPKIRLMRYFITSPHVQSVFRIPSLSNKDLKKKSRFVHKVHVVVRMISPAWVLLGSFWRQGFTGHLVPFSLKWPQLSHLWVRIPIPYPFSFLFCSLLLNIPSCLSNSFKTIPFMNFC